MERGRQKGGKKQDQWRREARKGGRMKIQETVLKWNQQSESLQFPATQQQMWPQAAVSAVKSPCRLTRHVSSLLADINECEDISDKVPLCQNGQCTNTEGSYKCTCLPGFVASAKPHKCIPAIPVSELEKTENWDSDFSRSPSEIALQPPPTPPPSLCPFPPRGPGTKPPTVTLRRPNSFPYITHTHAQTQTRTYEKAHTHAFRSPYTHSRGPGNVQWMYYMGFSIHQISICLKGILWTDFCLFSKTPPGNLICRYIFHIIFSVTFSLFCVIYFIYTTGLCKLKKATYFRGQTPFLLFYSSPRQRKGDR